MPLVNKNKVSGSGVRISEFGIVGREGENESRRKLFAKPRRNAPKPIQRHRRFRREKSTRRDFCERQWIGRGLRSVVHSRIPHLRSAIPAGRNGALSSISSQWPGGTGVIRRWSSNVQVTTRGKICCASQSDINWVSGVFALARGEFGGGGEEILRRTFHLLGEPAPVELSMLPAGTILFSASTAQAAWARARR